MHMINPKNTKQTEQSLKKKIKKSHTFHHKMWLLKFFQHMQFNLEGMAVMYLWRSRIVQWENYNTPYLHQTTCHKPPVANIVDPSAEKATSSTVPLMWRVWTHSLVWKITNLNH